MSACLSTRRVAIAVAVLVASSFAWQRSRAADERASFAFAAPVQLTTAEGPVSVESPGYACPAWADVDGDGDKDLLVGQFRNGQIRIYKNTGKDQTPPKLAAGKWLKVAGKVAEVPGVW